jgi:hypothetical protein
VISATQVLAAPSGGDETRPAKVRKLLDVGKPPIDELAVVGCDAGGRI